MLVMTEIFCNQSDWIIIIIFLSSKFKRKTSFADNFNYSFPYFFMFRFWCSGTMYGQRTVTLSLLLPVVVASLYQSKGEQCNQCCMGPPGSPGIHGSHGLPGTTGVDGPIGSRGEKGYPGEKGVFLLYSNPVITAWKITFEPSSMLLNWHISLKHVYINLYPNQLNSLILMNTLKAHCIPLLCISLFIRILWT